jgi:hypothetical protein
MYLAQEISLLQATRWQAKVSHCRMSIAKYMADLKRKRKWTGGQMMRSRNGFSESYKQLRNELHTWQDTDTLFWLVRRYLHLSLGGLG